MSITLKDMAKGLKPEDMFEPDHNLENEVDVYINTFEQENERLLSDDPLQHTLLALKDVNMEGFVKDTSTILKHLWAQFKQLISKMLSVARKVWLRSVIFFSKSNNKLSKYINRADKSIMIEVNREDKSEFENLIMDYIFNWKLKFPINTDIDTDQLYKDDNYDDIREILKYVRNPSKQTIDFLTNKTYCTFISIDKDTIYVAGSSKETNKDKYAKVYKEVIDKKYYINAKKELIDSIDNGDVTVEVKALFENIKDFSILVSMIDQASNKLKHYEHRADTLVNDSTNDTERVKAKYNAYTMETKFIYNTIKYNIKQTKLALAIGEILFD